MDAKKNGEFGRGVTTALSKRHEPLEFRVPPAADIYETDDAFTVQLDMPGAVKESIRVDVQPGRLSARADVARFHRLDARLLLGEIGPGVYFREFNLGTGVNHERAEAIYENGVLTITLPKSIKIKSREIAIK